MSGIHPAFKVKPSSQSEAKSKAKICASETPKLCPVRNMFLYVGASCGKIGIWNTRKRPRNSKFAFLKTMEFVLNHNNQYPLVLTFLILWEDTVSSDFIIFDFVREYGILSFWHFWFCERIRYPLVLTFLILWEDTVSFRFDILDFVRGYGILSFWHFWTYDLDLPILHLIMRW
jgi:hypothetical protein